MARSSCVTLHCYLLPPTINRALSTTCRRRSTSPQRKEAPVILQPPKRFTDIPGPLTLPMLRHSVHVLPRIGNFHHQVGLGILDSLRDRYGDLVRLAKGSRKRPVLYVFDPELMREVYDSGATKAPFWERSPLQKQRLLKNSQCTVSGKSTENIWPSLRAVLQDGSFLSNYDQAFDDIANDVSRRLGNLRSVEKELNENVVLEIYRWAIETLAMCVMGRRIGCLDGDTRTNSKNNKIPLEDLSAADRLVQVSREITEGEFLVRRENTLKSESETFKKALKTFDTHYCLVEHFLNKSLEDIDSGEDGKEMSLLKNLRPLNTLLLPLAADTLLAGVDLLSQTAISLLYQFSIHPARQQRVADELSWRTAAEDAESSQHELQYVAACVREGVRLHPATGGVVRRTMEDIIVGGYEIPEGVDIVLAHGVSSKTEIQFVRSKTFMPERWHSQGWEPIPASKAHPIATRPFGTTCPASVLVGKILGSLTSKLLENYRLEWHGPRPVLAHSGVNRLKPPYYFVLQNV